MTSRNSGKKIYIMSLDMEWTKNILYICLLIMQCPTQIVCACKDLCQ